MKEIIYFKRETCDKLSEDREEILQCEASHYGLTIAEKTGMGFFKRRMPLCWCYCNQN